MLRSSSNWLLRSMMLDSASTSQSTESMVGPNTPRVTSQLSTHFRHTLWPRQQALPAQQQMPRLQRKLQSTSLSFINPTSSFRLSSRRSALCTPMSFTLSTRSRHEWATSLRNQQRGLHQRSLHTGCNGCHAVSGVRTLAQLYPLLQ